MKKKLSPKHDCYSLTQEMLKAMKDDGYSCSHHFYIFNALVRFCKESYDGYYSTDAGAAFLAYKQEHIKSKEHMTECSLAMARLDHALIGDFHWHPSPPLKPYKSSCFDEIIIDYENYLSQTRKSKNDIRRHVRLAADFMAIAESNGITCTIDVTPSIIYEAFNKSSYKEEFRKIKPFLRYAYNHKLFSSDFSTFVPSVSRHKPLPSIYSQKEIDKVLNSIDRNTNTGKRDYCIILLAVRFGMRASDIATLSFDNIDEIGNVINIIQEKTGVSMMFPMSKEVADAFYDYVNNARPDADEPYVFMRIPHPLTGPLSTQRISTIVSDRLIAAGIDIKNRRHGSHALRASLATHLLNNGASYPEVQQVLGHTSPDAATHYIRVEAGKLRECAMEVPPVSESLRSYLEGRHRFP